MAAIMINQFARDLAGYSRKSHLIVVSLITVPTLIGLAWGAFPFLEARNYGYPVWHLSCFLGCMIAGFGIACWIAEKLIGVSSPSWIALLILAAFGIASIALILYGDFYWAFNRGYFLN